MSNMLTGLPRNHFRCLLADPPWSFKVRSERGADRSASQHYGIMGLRDIMELPVDEHCALDAWLFLWATLPMLPQALDVMDAWGFGYSGSAFVWAKQNLSGVGWFTGLGFTTRKNAELCLLGRRGNPSRQSKAVRELIVAPRREHSRKPDEAHERIETFCHGPRLELFGRQQRKGWRVLGDESARFSGIDSEPKGRLPDSP